MLLKILSGNSNNNLSFEELRSILLTLGFIERIAGSHHIFYKDGLEEILNIQPKGNKAKPCQVKQVRMVILKNKLAK